MYYAVMSAQNTLFSLPQQLVRNPKPNYTCAILRDTNTVVILPSSSPGHGSARHLTSRLAVTNRTCETCATKPKKNRKVSAALILHQSYHFIILDFCSTFHRYEKKVLKKAKHKNRDVDVLASEYEIDTSRRES